jgi:hypothetical protein
MLTQDTPNAGREAPTGSVRTRDAGLRGVNVQGCWITGLMLSPKFWFAVLAAFLTICAFDLVWHTQIMASEYIRTRVIWRPAEEMSRTLAYLSRLIQAFAYSYLIFAAMRTSRWLDALAAGFKIGLIGVALCILTWNVLPLASAVMPTKWAIGFMLEALCVAVVVKLVNQIFAEMSSPKRLPVARRAPSATPPRPPVQ